jgi:DNA-binding response OmpR family regulator
MTEIPVVIVADPHDELPSVTAALKEAVPQAEVLTDHNAALRRALEDRPLVMLLDFDGLDHAQVFCLDLLRRVQRERLDSLQMILLCSRQEAAKAYELCVRNIVDHYLVTRPLYDACQLPVIVKLARDRIVVRQWLADVTATTGGARDLRTLVRELWTVATPMLPTNPKLRRALDDLQGAVVTVSGQLVEGVRMVQQTRDSRSASAATVSPSVAPSASDEQPTVLVCDDDHLYATILREMLESEGYHVVTVHDASSACQRLLNTQLEPVDVVLMDIELPGLSGLEVTRRVRQTVATPVPPVIMLTVHSDTEHVVQAKQAGASDFIVKPGTRALVLDRVAASIGRSPRRIRMLASANNPTVTA